MPVHDTGIHVFQLKQCLKQWFRFLDVDDRIKSGHDELGGMVSNR